jgi:hypothetical protein
MAVLTALSAVCELLSLVIGAETTGLSVGMPGVDSVDFNVSNPGFGGVSACSKLLSMDIGIETETMHQWEVVTILAEASQSPLLVCTKGTIYTSERLH